MSTKTILSFVLLFLSINFSFSQIDEEYKRYQEEKRKRRLKLTEERFDNAYKMYQNGEIYKNKDLVEWVIPAFSGNNYFDLYQSRKKKVLEMKAARLIFINRVGSERKSYSPGAAISQDSKNLLTILQDAANHNEKGAARLLVNEYNPAYSDKKLGLKPSFEKMIYWGKKAASEGSKGIEYFLGFAYEKTENHPQALLWYKRDFQTNKTTSSAMSIMCYYAKGEKGISKNQTSANEYLKKLINKYRYGNVSGQFILAKWYYEGSYGDCYTIPRNVSKAKAIFKEIKSDRMVQEYLKDNNISLY